MAGPGGLPTRGSRRRTRSTGAAAGRGRLGDRPRDPRPVEPQRRARLLQEGALGGGRSRPRARSRARAARASGADPARAPRRGRGRGRSRAASPASPGRDRSPSAPAARSQGASRERAIVEVRPARLAPDHGAGRAAQRLLPGRRAGPISGRSVAVAEAADEHRAQRGRERGGGHGPRRRADRRDGGHERAEAPADAVRDPIGAGRRRRPARARPRRGASRRAGAGGRARRARRRPTPACGARARDRRRAPARCTPG